MNAAHEVVQRADIVHDEVQQGRIGGRPGRHPTFRVHRTARRI